MMSAMTATTAVGLTVLQVPDTGQMTQFYRHYFAAGQQDYADQEVTVLRFPSGGHLAYAAAQEATGTVRINLTVPDAGARDRILEALTADGHTTDGGVVLDPAGNTVALVVREVALPMGRTRVTAGTTHRFGAAARCRSLPIPAPARIQLPVAEVPKTPWDQLVDWFQRTGLRVTGAVLGVEKPTP